MTATTSVEALLRELAPQALGALVRRYGHFETAEDAVQEALLAASLQWPRDGTPQDPRAWLIRVASRKLTDMLRAEQSRRRREDAEVARALPTDLWSPAADTHPADAQDDSLLLLLLCCHPSLKPASQVALTLRAVGGLTTAEIARAFLVPEPTMAQRVSRAKQRLTEEGGRFRMPTPDEHPERLRAVLHVLYLIFNEGYTSTSGPRLHRVELTAEALRLTRLVRRVLPEDGEVSGLLALMLLTDARRPARTTPDGDLVPLGDQDRNLWDKGQVAEGVDLVTEALSRGTPGPYQLQAAIAAVHAEADLVEDTDWPQILALYELLEHVEKGNPAVVLNHAVAAAMVHGPRVGLAMLTRLDADPRMARNHRLDAVRAHLLEMAGDDGSAAATYRRAARRTSSAPERRYLDHRADLLQKR
ncbi:MAG TPA: sigma-70 family RNA polymerase sigma factor [Nocardioidaceae bacterium]